MMGAIGWMGEIVLKRKERKGVRKERKEESVIII